MYALEVTVCPPLSLTAVLTLALGIGAKTAIFTLLYGRVLRSLPKNLTSECMAYFLSKLDHLLVLVRQDVIQRSWGNVIKVVADGFQGDAQKQLHHLLLF